MIKIKNLFKIYNTSKTNQVLALHNVSLTLPNKGLVFILGKSGSGKSTFLNLLGALDNISKGEIIADNYALHSMNETELTDYRNNYVGFIFQDYSLIENLTVKENIALPLMIKGEENDSLISSILELVDLKGFENRKISTLSAGQKQRVAIARGYIKKPRLLLCDEPTGNLDSKTSNQILTLLKELSKTTLIIIVSHNRDDAEEFADRTIEIRDGEIFKDTIKEINNTKTSNNIVSKNNLSLKNKIKLTLKFQKQRIFSTFVISFFSSLIMVLFCLSQFFTMFDRNQVIEQAITSNNQITFSMKKAYSSPNSEQIDTSKLISITDEDDTKIINSGYKDKVYKLYNYSLPISLSYWCLQNEITINDKLNLSNLFLQETYGVAIIDEAFLNDVFSLNQILESSSIKDYGIYITDYIADSILYYRNNIYNTYEDILGIYRNASTSIYAYINGIIKTDYKEKYSSLFDEFLNSSNEDKQQLILSEKYMFFLEDVKNYLGVAYSLNDNFMKDSQTPQARNIARIDNVVLSAALLGNNEEIYFSNAFGYIDNVYSNITNVTSLPQNTIGVSSKVVNSLFGTTLTESQLSMMNGQTVTITKYRAHHISGGSPVFTKEFKIQIYQTLSFDFIFSEDVFTFLREYDMIPYSYIFTNLSEVPNVYYALEEVPFVPNSLYIDAGIEINKVVIVFNDFFLLISIILLLSILLILSSNAFSNVNHRKHEIGIFKALGMKNNDVASIFVLQILFSTVITILMFTIGILIFTNVTNNILFNSFMVYLKNPALKMIDILTFNVGAFSLDILLLVIINALTTLVPFINLRKLKPLNILRKSK